MSDPTLPDVTELFGDLFGELFGGRPEIHVDLAITDEEAAAGVTRDVEVRRADRCTACEGRGTAIPGEVATVCHACKGSGGSRTQAGFFVVANTCKVCHGRGRTIATPCTACTGAGVMRHPATIAVRVPAGTTHGSTIRVAGEGSLKPDEDVRADLVVFVLVGGRPDPRAQAAPQFAANAAELPMAQVHRPHGSNPSLIVGLVMLALGILLALALIK